MTDETQPQTRQAIAKTEDKPPKSADRITGRLAKALDFMTWGDETGKPMEWNEAARTVGSSARSMRRSLERATVRRYLMQQKEVIRVNLTARNSFHLNELVSQRENKAAAVACARLIENLDEPDPRRPTGGQVTQGLVIIIENAPTPALPAGQLEPIDITSRREPPAIEPAQRPPIAE